MTSGNGEDPDTLAHPENVGPVRVVQNFTVAMHGLVNETHRLARAAARNPEPLGKDYWRSLAATIRKGRDLMSATEEELLLEIGDKPR